MASESRQRSTSGLMLEIFFYFIIPANEKSIVLGRPTGSKLTHDLTLLIPISIKAFLVDNETAIR